MELVSGEEGNIPFYFFEFDMCLGHTNRFLQKTANYQNHFFASACVMCVQRVRHLMQYVLIIVEGDHN